MEQNETKLCPFCAEEILAAAIKCKHCGSALSDEALPQESRCLKCGSGGFKVTRQLERKPLISASGMLMMLLGGVPLAVLLFLKLTVAKSDFVNAVGVVEDYHWVVMVGLVVAGIFLLAMRRSVERQVCTKCETAR